MNFSRLKSRVFSACNKSVLLNTKRIVAVILSVAVILPIVACSRTPDEPGRTSQPVEDAPGQAEDAPMQAPQPGEEVSGQIVTRGQWVSLLTSVMGNNLQFDSETVVFFTDVSSDDLYYNSIQIAAAYNWIDTDQDTFNSTGEVTRAFVATTAAKALGLTGEPVSDFSDINEQQDSDYIRLAVDSEILSSENGIFNPDGFVSPEECQEILNRIRALTDLTIDPNHVDIMTLADGVVDLQHAADDITFNDSRAMTVFVTEEIAAGLDIGSVYILPPSTGSLDGVARKVLSISQNGDTYTIANEVPTIEEVVSEIDVQVRSYADLSGIVWDDSIAVESFELGTQVLSAGQDGYRIESLSFQAEPLASTSMTATLYLGDGVSATITINSLSYECHIQSFIGFPMEAMVQIDVSHTVTIDAAGQIKNSMDLFKLPLPIKPGISLEVTASLGVDGSFSLSITNDISSQIVFNSGRFGFGSSARVSNIQSTWDAEPEAKVNMEAGATFNIALNIFTLTFIEGSAFLGFEARASAFSYCTDIAVYAICYLKFVVLPKFEDELDLSHRIDIWTRRNSPLSERWHYESGELVEYCTLGAGEILALWESLGGGVWIDDIGYHFTFSIDARGEFAGKPIVTVEHSAWANTPVAVVTDMVILNNSTYRVYAVEEHDGVSYDLVFDLDVSNLSDGMILIDDLPRYFQGG